MNLKGEPAYVGRHCGATSTTSRPRWSTSTPTRSTTTARSTRSSRRRCSSTPSATSCSASGTCRTCSGTCTRARTGSCSRRSAIGSRVRTRSTIVERYQKRGRDYVVNETDVLDAADGRLLVRGRTHQSFLPPKQTRRRRRLRRRRGDGAAEGAGARGARAVPDRDRPELGAVHKMVDQRRCWMFSGPGANYHTDAEQAKKLGFPNIVVQGMMSTCFVAQVMHDAFGRGFLEGGRMSLKLTNVLWVDEAVTARGASPRAHAGGHAHARPLRRLGGEGRRHPDPARRRERARGAGGEGARPLLARARRRARRRSICRGPQRAGGGLGGHRLDRARPRRPRARGGSSGSSSARPRPPRPARRGGGRRRGLRARRSRAALGVPFAAAGSRRGACARAAASRARPRSRRPRAGCATPPSPSWPRRPAPSGSPPPTRSTTRPRPCCCGCCAAAGPPGSAASRSARRTGASCGRCSASRAPRSNASRAARGLLWREDASNRDPAYARARLRRDWLRGLAAAFNPHWLRAIGDLAEAQRRESEWIERSSQQEAGSRARPGAARAVDRSRASGWDARCRAALARRLARRVLHEAGGGRDVSRPHLERVLAFVASGARTGAPARAARRTRARAGAGRRAAPARRGGRAQHGC